MQYKGTGTSGKNNPVHSPADSPSDPARVSTTVAHSLRFFQKEEQADTQAPPRFACCPQKPRRMRCFKAELCRLARPRLTLRILP
jgi:hypothetical protein